MTERKAQITKRLKAFVLRYWRVLRHSRVAAALIGLAMVFTAAGFSISTIVAWPIWGRTLVSFGVIGGFLLFLFSIRSKASLSAATASQPRTEPTNESSGSPNRWVRVVGVIALSLVSLILLAVIVYGVFQPLILRLRGINQGEDLKVADIISILIAVVALLTASLGFVIYQFVTRALDDRVGREVATARDILSRDADQNLALAIVTQRSGAVLDAWQRLLPSLSGKEAGCCAPEIWPGPLIDSGLRAARVAGLWLPRVAKEKREALAQAVALNEAFFIACYFMYLTAKEIDPHELGSDPRRALALVKPYESLDPSGEGYRDEETVTWVLLCCSNDDDTRRTAKDRAIALLGGHSANPVREAWIQLTRQRYKNAFGDDFFGAPTSANNT